MVSGSRYYRAPESVSIASALSTALTIYPCQIRVHQRCHNADSLNSNFLQLGRRSGGWPQRTVYPRRLPVNTVIHTTLAGLEPTAFRLLVRRATSSATDSLSAKIQLKMLLPEFTSIHRRRNRVGRVGQVLHRFWGV